MLNYIVIGKYNKTENDPGSLFHNIYEKPSIRLA